MEEQFIARFQDARWYVGGEDDLHETIYDASDLFGTGPNGHGMVCEGAVLQDARLIAASPALLGIVLGFLATLNAPNNGHAHHYYNEHIELFNLAIETIQELNKFEEHSHTYAMKADGVTRQMDPVCGAYICLDCEDHEGLARCYCGWATNGGDGVRQLQDQGENVEDDY